MKRTSLILLILTGLIAINASAQFSIVKDITPGAAGTFASNDEATGIVASFGNEALVIIHRDSFELWITDGNDEGTGIVQVMPDGGEYLDFIDGSDSVMYFTTDEVDSFNLYSFTWADRSVSLLHSSNERVSYATLRDSSMYFASDNLLRKLNLNTNEVETVFTFSFFGGIRDISEFNGDLIIIARDDVGTQLFVSDGTMSGTVPYYLLNEGSEFSSGYYMTPVGDKLFFFYSSPDQPYALFVTDGTPEGTMPLIELTQIPFRDLESERAIIGWEGKLFFLGRGPNSGGNQDELYVSDGTIQGTSVLNVNDSWPKPRFFTPYKDELYFYADYAGAIYSVWKTDGTQNGTVAAFDDSELGGGLSFGGFDLNVYMDSLVFSGCRSQTGCELWISAGTTESTFVREQIPGGESAYPVNITPTEDDLLFIYDSPEFGRELFKYNPGDVTTSTARVIESDELKVYPNPANESFVVENQMDYEVEFTMYNAAGAHIIESMQLGPGSKRRIPLNCPPGVYMYNIIGNSTFLSLGKLVVID